jgi:hypothetical protein
MDTVTVIRVAAGVLVLVALPWMLIRAFRKPASEKRRLLSRQAWIVCLIMSALVAIANAARTAAAAGMGFGREFIEFAVGAFVGALILFAGGWAIVVQVARWISGLRSRKRPLA